MKLILILFNIHQILFLISIIKNHNINSFNTISRFFKLIFLLTLYFKSGSSNFSTSGRKPNRPSNQHSYNAQAPPQSLQNANKPPNLFSQQQQQQLYFAQQSAPRMNVHIFNGFLNSIISFRILVIVSHRHNNQIILDIKTIKQDFSEVVFDFRYLLFFHLFNFLIKLYNYFNFWCFFVYSKITL